MIFKELLDDGIGAFMIHPLIFYSIEVIQRHYIFRPISDILRNGFKRYNRDN
jgi:hypothetical protein